MFQLMDAYGAVLTVVFLAFCEVVALCWIFGKILLVAQEQMTGVLLFMFYYVLAHQVFFPKVLIKSP